MQKVNDGRERSGPRLPARGGPSGTRWEGHGSISGLTSCSGRQLESD